MRRCCLPVRAGVLFLKLLRLEVCCLGGLLVECARSCALYAIVFVDVHPVPVRGILCLSVFQVRVFRIVLAHVP